MELKKLENYLSFVVLLLLLLKKKKSLRSFSKIGKDIGLLFQIVDDLIDFKGKTKHAGKKTKKTLKRVRLP